MAARRVVVIGAGIIGAASAVRLARAGLSVTVIGLAGGGASAASFGWLNASFRADDTHHRLRAEGIAAWHRLAHDMRHLPLSWPGALAWDWSPDQQAAESAALMTLGYPVERIAQADIARREPALVDPPEAALLFPSEGAAETATLTAGLLAGAQASGARHLSGVAVQSLAACGGRITGVDTDIGRIPADHVVLAAGCGAPRLLQSVGLHLPMRPRPALMIRTAPYGHRLSHILVAPAAEIRQMPCGRLLVPGAAGHQGDASETPAQDGGAGAERMMAYLETVLRDASNLDWEEAQLAWRPYPEDGLPVIGGCAIEGLSLGVMHSGVTLAAIAAEILSARITGGAFPQLDLSPYRLARFGAKPGVPRSSG